jgi:hypothetical protein
MDIISVMRKIIITAIIIALSVTLGGVAFAAETQVAIKPKWSDPSLAPQEERVCDGYAEDSLLLTIKKGKEEISKEFCSSYGIANGKIIKDARGHYFLFLEFSEGRGNEAIVESKYLSVYKVSEPLIEYVRIPIADSAGWRSAWFYDYKIKKPKQGGLIIYLSLQLSGFYTDIYPVEKKRTIQIK